jgi:xyloglucan-specific exo-beta-1,4-glucanase
LLGFLVASSGSVCLGLNTQAYNWKNVKIGGGGGFVPGIVFNPSQQNLAYARTDIGGAYRLNLDGTWSPLLDFVDDARWNYWGVDALATDPVEPKRLYLATGMYTNSWDPNNGQILASIDYGTTWTASSLPFKVGGNMPGRGMGEVSATVIVATQRAVLMFCQRLAVDPNRNSVLYFGARSGNGLWKSTDYGKTWNKVTSFTSVGESSTLVHEPRSDAPSRHVYT